MIEDNTKFINYRPTAEFFDGIIDNGENQKLRNLGPIDIADNVYICSNVILYPNVKIGKNCLILDGSVITTSIEENSVVMGNPARVIAKIDDWYLNIKNINLKYPWYNKNISHDEICLLYTSVNKYMQYYPVYSDNMIIVDRDNINIPDNFMAKEYVINSYHSLSIDMWIKKIGL